MVGPLRRFVLLAAARVTDISVLKAKIRPLLPLNAVLLALAVRITDISVLEFRCVAPPDIGLRNLSYDILGELKTEASV